jgi:hypothetical protein
VQNRQKYYFIFRFSVKLQTMGGFLLLVACRFSNIYTIGLPWYFLCSALSVAAKAEQTLAETELMR